MPLIKLSATQWVNLDQVTFVSDNPGTSVLTVRLSDGSTQTVSGTLRTNLLNLLSATANQGPINYRPS